MSKTYERNGIPVTIRVKRTKTGAINKRVKWVTISAKFINGDTVELAKFNVNYPGDANLYIQRLTEGSTVEAVFLD